MSIFAPSNRIWLKNVSITNKSQNLKFKLRNSLFSADLNSPDVRPSNYENKREHKTEEFL